MLFLIFLYFVLFCFVYPSHTNIFNIVWYLKYPDVFTHNKLNCSQSTNLDHALKKVTPLHFLWNTSRTQQSYQRERHHAECSCVCLQTSCVSINTPLPHTLLSSHPPKPPTPPLHTCNAHTNVAPLLIAHTFVIFKVVSSHEKPN